MSIDEIRKIVNDKMNRSDYYGIYLFINELTESYLASRTPDYILCVELITQNQDLFEYLGSSKQFESDFELNKKTQQNRNRLFLSCFTDDQKELKNLFKRCVGDYSASY